MKHTKRIVSVLLALVMVLSMAISVSAALTEVTDKGSITILDNDTVKASQKKFDAYKILDLKAYANEDGKIETYAYTVPTELADFYAARYTLDKTATDFDAQVVAKIKAESDIYDFAEEVLEANKAKLTAYAGAAIEGGYQFDNLPLGYYIISDVTTTGQVKPVSALILDTATPNVEIAVKAEIPPIEKKIDEDNDLTTTDDRVDTNEASIGDTITYVITSKVPDMIGYDKYFFIINDTMSKGLTYKNNLVVKLDGATLTAGTDYTLTVTNNEDGTTGLKIVFNDFEQYYPENEGAAITVTYTAELNEQAEISPASNPNDVYLNYSNNPSIEYDGDDEPNENDKEKDPIGETPKDTVWTYTAAIEIIKVDPDGNRLEGAEFTLSGTGLNVVRVETETFTKDANGTYWLLNDGSYTTTDPNSTIDGAPVDQTKYVSLTDKYTKTTTTEVIKKEGETVTATGTVGTDGTVRFEGLGEGTYTITEIKAPAGYNILTKELEVVISWNEDDGKFAYTGATDVNGIAQVTVVNQSGSELPETGGVGTTLFYVLGGLMVAAAVVLLVTKKRMTYAE